MPKKPARNGFYFFMKDIEPQLRKEGRQFPNGMADVVAVAHPRWKQLPQKERDRYDNMAKREKARLRGHVGDVYREDNMGNNLATRKDKYTELEKRRLAEKKDIVKNWPPGKELKKETFYFINVQYLCKTDEDEYLPAEIAAIEYSIEKGISKQLHRFIEPGRIPTGYRFTCVQNSEDSHKIPVEGFNLADSNYTGLWIQLKNFVNPNGEKPDYPPLYCLGAMNNYQAVEGCLDWIHGRACMGEPNCFQKVYEVESLFQEMHAHLGNQVSKTQCIDRLTSSDWDYHPKTRCTYHEELEVKDCALGVVNRYAYTISDSLCEFFDVQLTSKHVPTTEDTGTVTVLSPSSMPVCPYQESRLPQKSDYFAKPKSQKARPSGQEDYTELRRPKPVAPVQTAPAWGGAMGGVSSSDGAYSSMGGVNGSMGRGSAQMGRSSVPMGRGSVPMGRAGAPLADTYSDNYPPMPGGRGLTVGLQEMSLNQKPAGRGILLNQSETYTTPMWQQPPTISTLQPSGGIGRGMINRTAQAPHPGLGADDDDMPPLRRPGQPPTQSSAVTSATSRLPAQQSSYPQEQSYIPPQQSSHVSTSASSKTSHVDGTYPPVGRGRGGILEDLMRTGVRPGVPCGRGVAPPDLVEKMRLANCR